MINKNKIQYDKLLSDLIGDSLVHIQYYEIQYEEQGYDMGNFHSLDYGISFKTKKGYEYYITWDFQFSQFDIQFSKGKLSDEFSVDAQIATYNLTQDKNWVDKIDIPILNAESVWYEVAQAPGDIVVSFNDGSTIVFSNIEINSEGKVRGSADHLTVFFSKDAAREFNVNI